MTDSEYSHYEAQLFNVDQWCDCPGTDPTLPCVAVWVGDDAIPHH